MPRNPSPARAIAKPAGAFHHGDLRRALLDAAMQLLERDGPLGVGLRAVARLAGVSQTAPYRHFADKEAMLAALAEQGLRDLGAKMAEAAARPSSDPRAPLVALGEIYVSFAAEHTELFRLMFGPHVANKKRCPAVDEAGARGYQVLLDAIAAAQRAGIIRPGDITALALTRWAAIHGLACLVVDGRLTEQVARAGGVCQLVRAVAEELTRGAMPR